ncbi:hypothetical protein ABZ541_28970 [Micromonospora sediminicola]|uniref:hypothetical protein n=1 Tax=Micromonospora sediminicola TaxID=946078 RepID=UPI0033F6E5AB
MDNREEALRALEDRDWSAASVDTARPRDVMIVVSARLPGDTAAALFAEAEARGVKPGALVRDFVEQCLAVTGEATAQSVVTIDPTVFRNEIEQAIRRAQRPSRAA